MMGSYEEVIQDSFINKPLRAVLMIDDQFPTYSELCGNGLPIGNDGNRAATLYREFRKQKMLCDIASTVETVDPEHLLKGDLIILDYHLEPDTSDNAKAIEILRTLAKSPHFNTVVVYTNESNQDEVWLETITAISGPWSTPQLSDEAEEHFNRLSDEGTLPQPSLEGIKQYARRGNFRKISAEARQPFVQELEGLNVPRKTANEIFNYQIAQHVRKLAGEESGSRSPAVGDCDDGTRWIQVGNVFVVIMQKTSGTEDRLEAEIIMDTLKDALLGWRPNLIQILISEIQNTLESEGLVGTDPSLSKPDMQVGLIYSFLKELGAFDPSKGKSHHLRVAATSLVDKVVDSTRKALSHHERLLDHFEMALLGESDKPHSDQDNNLLHLAKSLARNDGATNPEIMFRLNHFLSTEKFQGAHLTTGTVFRHPGDKEYFVVASPACDLVAGRSKLNESRHWQNGLHPIFPLIAIHLQEENLDTALKGATHGEYIFLEIGDKQMAFRVVAGSGRQPSYEMFFIENEGRVVKRDGKTEFSGLRLTRKLSASPKEEPAAFQAEETEDPTSGQDNVAECVAPAGENNEQIELRADTFEILEQLRGLNATHLLQVLGRHLSRVGLDYVGQPT